MNLRHDALIFATDDELVQGTQDLVEQGVLEGDRVLVLEDDHHRGVLRDAWRDDPRITFADSSEFYKHPMRTIADLQRMLEREVARGYRVRVTGPVPFGEDPRTRRGWMLYEALVDRAFAPYGLVSVCQYDTRVLDSDLIDHAWATHDRVITPSGVTAGGQLRAEVWAQLAQRPQADPLEHTPADYECVVTGPDTLARIRAGLSATRDDFVVAVNEIVTNALQHGRPPITVRLHRGDGRWVCVVTDNGPGLRDPSAGVDSPLLGNPAAAGRGLWLARQLCDDLWITCREGGAGTTVYLTQQP